MDRSQPDTGISPLLEVEKKLSADAILPKTARTNYPACDKLVAIGASTGGTQALEQVLSCLNSDVPGIVIVQHMPEAFTGTFVKRLDSISKVKVGQAEDGEIIQPGKVLISPGDRHMIVENRAGTLRVRIKSGSPVNRHRPSVDVLFRSVAQAAAKQTLGIIMTGMGDDGANGMKEMFDAGAFTVAQDKASCVIFGMPAVAIERGGVRKISPLQQIPQLINAYNRPIDFKRYL